MCDLNRAKQGSSVIVVFVRRRGVATDRLHEKAQFYGIMFFAGVQNVTDKLQAHQQE